MSTENPLHADEGPRRPSAAYMESLARARANRIHDGESVMVRERLPGWRTITSAIVFLLAGVIMFITGAVYRWTSDGTEKHNQGMDLLIVGGILLLPGMYATTVLIGAYLGWPGYSYNQVPSMDNII
jgi:hypothetical protein